jgi:hypothetical protein
MFEISQTVNHGDSCILPQTSKGSRQHTEGRRGSSIGELLDRKNNQIIGFESDVKRKALLWLLTNRYVNSVLDQPPRIYFIDADGRLRWHTFDFYVRTICGKRIFIFVKTKKRIEEGGWVQRCQHMATFIDPKIANAIKIIDNTQISSILAANSGLFLAALGEAEPELDQQVLKLVEAAPASLSLETISNRLHDPEPCMRSIARLLAGEAVRLVTNEVLGPRSLVQSNKCSQAYAHV